MNVKQIVQKAKMICKIYEITDPSNKKTVIPPVIQRGRPDPSLHVTLVSKDISYYGKQDGPLRPCASGKCTFNSFAVIYGRPPVGLYNSGSYHLITKKVLHRPGKYRSERGICTHYKLVPLHY